MRSQKRQVIETLLFKANLGRLKVVYFLFFLVEALFLFYVERVRLLSADGNMYDQIMASYLLHLVMAITTIGFAVAFHLMHHGHTEGRILSSLPFVSMFLVLTASATISLLNQLTGATTILFIAHLIILGLLTFVKPYWNFLLYIAPFTIYLVGILFFQDSTDLMTTQLINGGAALAGVLFASKAFYDHKVYSLHYRITLKRANKELERLSTLDPLTHLPNRRYFEDQVKYEVAISRRYQLSASFLMLDIDYFKKVNDALGHDAGDKILVELSGILKENVRDSDTVCRYGGEEFMLLLSHTDMKGATILAKRLRKVIENHAFIDNTNPANITVSIGVSPLLHNLDNPYKSSYLLVDKALYEAKEKGRNRVITLKEAPPTKEDA